MRVRYHARLAQHAQAATDAYRHPARPSGLSPLSITGCLARGVNKRTSQACPVSFLLRRAEDASPPGPMPQVRPGRSLSAYIKISPLATLKCPLDPPRRCRWQVPGFSTGLCDEDWTHKSTLSTSACLILPIFLRQPGHRERRTETGRWRATCLLTDLSSKESRHTGVQTARSASPFGIAALRRGRGHLCGRLGCSCRFGGLLNPHASRRSTQRGADDDDKTNRSVAHRGEVLRGLVRRKARPRPWRTAGEPPGLDD